VNWQPAGNNTLLFVKGETITFF